MEAGSSYRVSMAFIAYPKPSEILELRRLADLSRTAAGARVYVSEMTWLRFEVGDWAMSRGLWELAQYKIGGKPIPLTGYPEGKWSPQNGRKRKPKTPPAASLIDGTPPARTDTPQANTPYIVGPAQGTLTDTPQANTPYIVGPAQGTLTDTSYTVAPRQPTRKKSKIEKLRDKDRATDFAARIQAVQAKKLAKKEGVVLFSD